jgi:hypothetical protein
MTSVLLLSSVQGHQVARVKTIAQKLREHDPSIEVEVLEGDRNVEALKVYKLQFGPAVVIDNRLEFVGIPRLSMLLNRVAIARKRAETSMPSTDTFKVEAPAKESRVVTLLGRPAAATAPPEFQPSPKPKPGAK